MLRPLAPSLNGRPPLIAFSRVNPRNSHSRIDPLIRDDDSVPSDVTGTHGDLDGVRVNRKRRRGRPAPTRPRKADLVNKAIGRASLERVHPSGTEQTTVSATARTTTPTDSSHLLSVLDSTDGVGGGGAGGADGGMVGFVRQGSFRNRPLSSSAVASGYGAKVVPPPSGGVGGSSGGPYASGATLGDRSYVNPLMSGRGSTRSRAGSIGGGGGTSRGHVHDGAEFAGDGGAGEWLDDTVPVGISTRADSLAGFGGVGGVAAGAGGGSGGGGGAHLGYSDGFSGDRSKKKEAGREPAGTGGWRTVTDTMGVDRKACAGHVEAYEFWCEMVELAAAAAVAHRIEPSFVAQLIASQAERVPTATHSLVLNVEDASNRATAIGPPAVVRAIVNESSE